MTERNERDYDKLLNMSNNTTTELSKISKAIYLEYP